MKELLLFFGIIIVHVSWLEDFTSSVPFCHHSSKYSKLKLNIVRKIYVVVFFLVYSKLKWEVVVHFADIVGIIYHYCLNFLFIIKVISSYFL